MERQNTRPWVASLKTTCCQAPRDLQSRLEALLAEMFDLRRVLSLVTPYSTKRRKVKLSWRGKQSYILKLLSERGSGGPVQWHSWNGIRISTPLHVQKQAILYQQETDFPVAITVPPRNMFPLWALALNHTCFVKMQNVLCYSLLSVLHSSK